MTYLDRIGAIVWKDLLLEFRTGGRLAAMAAFAVLSALLLAFALDLAVVRPRDVAAGLVWMTLIFAGLLGLGRTFQLEAEEGAFDGVLMSPTPRDAVFLGKMIANYLLVALVGVLVVAAFMLFLRVDLGPHPGAVTLALALGCLGFVALGTLFSAVASATRMGETLLPVLLFPLLAPAVIFGSTATARLLNARPPGEVAGTLRLLAAFALLAVVGGAGLFRFVVEE